MIKASSLLIVGALVLVACGDNTATRGIATLGQDFVNAFNAAPNDAPVDASEITLALSPTIEPFDP